MKTSFTRHAWSRVLGRVSLSPGDVADLLDWDLAINIGVERDSCRVHRLFFSAPDGMCFVAVQDEKNGAVVTVLPVDFHENSSWKVSEAAQQAARMLACPGESELLRTGMATLETASAPGPSIFGIGAYVRGPCGTVKAVKLGSWPCLPYHGHVERLLEDDGFFSALEERLAAEGIPNDHLESVYVRLGNDGKSIRISLGSRSQERPAQEAVAVPVQL